MTSIIDPFKDFYSRVIATAKVNDTTGLDQSEYDFTNKIFPADLGASYQGHYMVININVPVHADGRNRGSYSNQYKTLSNEFSKVDVLRFSNWAGELPGIQREGLALPRHTRRIAESIALFMPNTIVHTSMNKYEEISLTAIAGQVGVGVAQGIFSQLGSVGGLAGNLVSGLGQQIGTIGQISGYPINPRVEILFSTTNQRQFVFEILMAPRNEKESDAIETIVRTLRFHGAPEIDTVFKGMIFIPPSEFDITFFHNGQENTKIPRINTCVLDRIDADYNPTGEYSTFSNGHPVAVRLVLGFTEVEILHKRRVLEGF